MFKESALPLSYIPRPLKNYFEKNNIFIWGQNKGFSVFDTESNYIAQTSGSQALDFQLLHDRIIEVCYYTSFM